MFGLSSRGNWELLRVLEQKSDLVNVVLQGLMSHRKETKKTLLFPSVPPPHPPTPRCL